jgi:Ni,Fe-hydrogenase I large subunit
VARTVIDPVTRVNGPLRVEVQIAAGAVQDAWSCGTMFRGMEAILRDHDPRDVWLLAQRICGSCNGVHALASVRAVESAIGASIPPNARLVRNLLAATQFVQDHVVRFYHQHAVDWVDLSSALSASPAAAAALASSMSDWPLSTDTYFKAIQDRLAAFVAAGQLGPFAGGYWGHPAYRLAPEANLVVLAHYFEALDWQRRFMKMHTLLGGKSPHPQTFLVGGMALAVPWGGPAQARPGEHPQQVSRDSPPALSSAGLAAMDGLIALAQSFVEKIYLPDVTLIATAYRDWATYGRGIGNYLAFGEFPEDDAAVPRLLLPRGRIMDRVLTTAQSVDQSGVVENTAHSWYDDDRGPSGWRHPWDGAPAPHYSGPPPPVTTLEGSDRYSWVRAARYQEQAVEVGPLARLLVGLAEGRDEVRSAVEPVLSRLGAGPDALFSTLGRVVARAVEAKVVVNRMPTWRRQLSDNFAGGDIAIADGSRWDPGSWPAQARGWSLGESPVGALGHWITIGDRRISGYQVVDGTTWNGSPRDVNGRRGALEEALVGTPVADPARPLEILRTVHSFDPCPVCAVQVFDPGSRRRHAGVAGGASR